MLADNLHNIELHCISTSIPDEDDNDDVPQQGASKMFQRMCVCVCVL